MANPKKSFAEIISQTQVMISGLKNKATEVAKRGIDSTFTTEMEELRKEVIEENDKQERLKAELKTQTERLDAKIKLLNEKQREAKKVVKLTIPPSGWLEFGIEDKK